MPAEACQDGENREDEGAEEAQGEEAEENEHENSEESSEEEKSGDEEYPTESDRNTKQTFANTHTTASETSLTPRPIILICLICFLLDL